MNPIVVVDGVAVAAVVGVVVDAAVVGVVGVVVVAGGCVELELVEPRSGAD